jgi:hypothetical protein
LYFKINKDLQIRKLKRTTAYFLLLQYYHYYNEFSRAILLCIFVL